MRACWQLLCAASATLVVLPQVAGQSEFYTPGDQTPLGAVANGTISACHQACMQLRNAELPDLITNYPDLPAEYHLLFFSAQQGEALPICHVQPQTAEAVSHVVKAVTQHGCPFAIKSGGHGIAAGTTNLKDGLVIDLHYLNQIDVSEDRKTVFLGPANKWRDVYPKLEAQDLLVIGGRVGSVGVGGFTLGGGISFLSNRYGWAADNIRNFEVVLPDGTLTSANLTSNPDLYFALRGGGGNFGIVTRFDFEAIPRSTLSVGLMIMIPSDLAELEAKAGVEKPFEWNFNSIATLASTWAQQLAIKIGYGTKLTDIAEAFMHFTSQPDLDAHVYLAFTYVPAVKAYLPTITYAYGKPVESSKALENLTSLPYVSSTARLANMSDFTQEIDDLGPDNVRNYWRTSTFKADKDLILKFWEAIRIESDLIRSTVPDAMVSSNIQLITKNQVALMSKNGGNVFGFKEEDAPLLFFSSTTTYGDAKDDAAIQRMGENIISRITEYGKEKGLYHPFVYRNYAWGDQDFFAGISTENQKRLKEIHAKYDPGNVFAGLQPVRFGF